MTYSTRLLTTVAALGLAACGGSTGATATLPSGVPIAIAVADSPQRGPSDAWVTIVEFADFQCPYCRAEEPVLAALLATRPDDVRLVFKHFPLASHANARSAAVAAECANRQGRFWKMHDLLMETALDSGNLLHDASLAGVDVAAWQACLGDPGAAAVVDADAALGASLGVPGTPTLVVNGEPVVGAVDEELLGSLVQQAKAKAIASGIPRAAYYETAVLGAKP